MVQRMRTEDELLHVAVNLKLKLQKRSSKLLRLHAAIALYDSGQTRDIKPQRVETMRDEIEKATDKQAREGLMYATLRWALGGAEDITENDLDL